jgi:tetratricopeptide (TPR) repeat protein/quercetin dioxygenase-like cupin family protein
MVRMAGNRWMKPLLFSIILLWSIFSLSAQDEAQGRIINLQGRVEYVPAEQEIWGRAKILQDLFVLDRVQTFLKSRAAILFIDETQVRLNANAELTVRELKQEDTRASVFDLIKGEGWFRTKNPDSNLEVNTPAATAAIRGSEINIRVSESGETILTVLEGTIKFFNDAGSILVNPGEEAFARPGEPPTKRVVLHPEDAVQWVLYYPLTISFHDLFQEDMSGPARAGFEILQKNDPRGSIEQFAPYLDSDGWARIGSALAYLKSGEADEALQLLQADVPPELETERLAFLAAIALHSGEVDTARQLIDSALQLDPTALRASVFLSSIELIQNKKEKAQAIALKALEAHPGSVAAHTAAGEAAQAFFDLDRAAMLYTRALELDPEDLHARVNRARVRFGSGDTGGALRDGEIAGDIAPDDAQVRSLLGFIKISRGDKPGARDDFEQAIKDNPDLSEPHLGLGLLHFQKGKEEDGLWEMLIATLLGPKVSLYQSYLGKAYYQLRRDSEGLAVLDSAARLDLRDPTPRLYKSLFLKDMNRYVDALYELNEAIALNDNRAVYRSRLLLDQDLATKNVSLAQVYWQLGFAPWGIHQALNSLNADFGNPSAHIFLAELYGLIPDRLQAMVSELLQYQLLAPVNRNLFSSYNEYTVLFEKPTFSFTLYGEAGYPWFGLGEIGTRSGSNNFAHLFYISPKVLESFRVDELDKRLSVYGQGKIALCRTTDLLIEAQYYYTDYGNDETEVITVGEDTSYPMNIQVVAEHPDPTYDTNTQYIVSTIGFKHLFGVASPFLAVIQYENIQDFTVDPDAPSAVSGILLDTEIESTWDLFDTQVQQIFQLGTKNQLITGLETYITKLTRYDVIDAYDETTGISVLDWTDFFLSDSLGVALWLWDQWQILDWLHATAGFRFQKDIGEDLLSPQNYDYAGIYPLIGVSLDIGDNAVLRAAAFQRMNTRMFGSKISPTTVEGFLLERNEPEYTKRTELNLSFETEGKRLFQMSHLFYRHHEYPPGSGITYPFKESHHIGLNNYFNLILTKFLCFSAENQFIVISTTPFTELDNQFRSGLTLTFPFGMTVRLTDTLILQTYPQSIFSELTDSFFNLLDLQVRFTLPGKRGVLLLEATNLLDQKFETFIEGLTINPILPYRRILFTFSLRI